MKHANTRAQHKQEDAIASVRVVRRQFSVVVDAFVGFLVCLAATNFKSSSIPQPTFAYFIVRLMQTTQSEEKCDAFARRHRRSTSKDEDMIFFCGHFVVVICFNRTTRVSVSARCVCFFKWHRLAHFPCLHHSTSSSVSFVCQIFVFIFNHFHRRRRHGHSKCH